MARFSSSEIRQYSRALTAYTLVQFAAAHSALDRDKDAADKLPAAHARDRYIRRQMPDVTKSPDGPTSPNGQSDDGSLKSEISNEEPPSTDSGGSDHMH